MSDSVRRSILIFTYIVLIVLLLIIGVEILLMAGVILCNLLGLSAIGPYVGIILAIAGMATGVIPKMMNFIAKTLVKGFDDFMTSVLVKSV